MSDGSPILQPREPAPADYYQNNLTQAFSFVLDRYADVLVADQADSLRLFLAASADAQRLLARLLTRSGPYFLRSTLNYSEVSSPDRAITELHHRGLISFDAGAADRLMKLYTKKVLCECFKLPVPIQRSSKPQIIEYLLGRYADGQIAKRLAKAQPWVRLCHPSHWRLARLLFFGRANQDWSTFVRKDLGQVRYEELLLSGPQYPDATSLSNRLWAQKLQHLCYRLDEYPQLVPALFEACTAAMQDHKSADRLQRCVLLLGRWVERNARPDLALNVYELTNKPPARERRVRILQRLGRSEAAESLRQEILSEPLSAKEQVFAERFGRRGAGFQPAVTEMLIHGPYDSIEAYALQAIVPDSGWGVHCENNLFKSLTGLLYWPVIFADVEDAFTNPFQSAPHDLFDEDFCHRRRALLTQHEARLTDDNELLAFLSQAYSAKLGTANRLVNWSLFQTVPLAQWLEAMPVRVIRLLCQFLIRNLADYRSGFPDLFICYGRGDFEFIEVKGPGDQLQPQQRAWFRVFDELKLPARVAKLRPE